MKIIALETSAVTASVAVTDDERLLAQYIHAPIMISQKK